MWYTCPFCLCLFFMIMTILSALCCCMFLSLTGKSHIKVLLGNDRTTRISRNTLEPYIYSKTLCKDSITSFVQNLAVFGITSCLLGMPGERVDILFSYTFMARLMCQMLTFIILFTPQAAGTILAGIAAKCCKKVCAPSQKQIPPSSRK